MHSATGLDHLLVIIATGYWAARSGDHGITDIAYILLMLLSGVMLGACCLYFPMLQLSSILAIVLVVTFAALMIATPRYFAYLLFGGFALYSGIVHTLAVPSAELTTGYVAGLFFATALLLMFGLILRQVVITRRPHSQT